MKPLSSHLDAIKELRFEHSRQAAAGDFSRMSTVTTKIVKAWADYHEASATALSAGVCFNCNAKAQTKFTCEYPNRPTMLFCSEACLYTFSTSLGLV